MTKKYQLLNGQVVPSDETGSPIVVYINPEGKERDEILTTFQIDQHMLSSALDPDEISRVESTPERLFVIWKRPMNYSGEDNFFFNVASIGISLTQNRLLLILTEEIPLTGGGTRQMPAPQSIAELMLVFLYSTILHYMEHLKVIKLIARELQKKINTSMENEHLIQMFNLSESLVYYENAINANGVVLTRLRTHFEKCGALPHVLELLDDISIENNQCFKQAEIYSLVFTGMMDARGSLVNNNVNVLLRNLTLINVVFLPLNLLASIGGMSEYSMMTQGLDWRLAYGGFLLAMVLIGFFTAYALRRVNFTASASSSRAVKRKLNQLLKGKGVNGGQHR